MKELIFECYGEEFNLTKAMEKEEGCRFDNPLDSLIDAFLNKGSDEYLNKNDIEEELKQRCFNAIYHYIRSNKEHTGRGYSAVTVLDLHDKYWPQVLEAIND